MRLCLSIKEEELNHRVRKEGFLQSSALAKVK